MWICKDSGEEGNGGKEKEDDIYSIRSKFYMQSNVPFISFIGFAITDLICFCFEIEKYQLLESL